MTTPMKPFSPDNLLGFYRLEKGTTHSKFVEFTPAKLALFKAAYAEHKDRPEDVFIFDGCEFLSSYAKYLIEYVETKFARGGSQ